MAHRVVVFCAKELVPTFPHWSESASFGDFEEFLALFKKYRDSHQKIDRLAIISHGQPGAISTGGKAVATTQLWRTLRGKGFDAMFLPHSLVGFCACNVGQGDLGLEFLKEFGRTFFFHSGGSVFASDSKAVPVPFTGDPFFLPWGTLRYVNFRPGGLVDSIEEEGTGTT